MGNGFPFLDILLFGMVALFLVLRLRNVLGRRTGHERQRPEPFIRRGSLEPGGAATSDRHSTEDQALEAEGARPATESLESGLASVKSADRSFSEDNFLNGARVAFEMIVVGYGSGRTAELGALLSNDVLDNFNSATESRRRQGLVTETNLVSIKSANIVEAGLRGRTAFVTVKFVSEQIIVTKNAAGEVVEGDPNRVIEVTDIWIFARNTRSGDPNWTLVETRTPN